MKSWCLSGNKIAVIGIMLFIFIIVITSSVLADVNIAINKQQVLTMLERHYGERAAKRGNAWFKLINDQQQHSNQQKLEQVNRFFNQFHFIDDIKLWGKQNYWATPIEFIGVNGGDCEDYSIAKYFTLIELGVPDEKMRITMVKAKQLNQYHMVLAYYETPAAMPLILDNLDGVIKPASQRADLTPIYSFNGRQLWLNKEKGQGVLSGKSSRLKQWRNLRERIVSATLNQPKLKMEF